TGTRTLGGTRCRTRVQRRITDGLGRTVRTLGALATTFSTTVLTLRTGTLRAIALRTLVLRTFRLRTLATTLSLLAGRTTTKGRLGRCATGRNLGCTLTEIDLRTRLRRGLGSLDSLGRFDGFGSFYRLGGLNGR